MALFPTIVTLLGPVGILTFVVLAGSVLYVAPVDRLIPSFHRLYVDRFESHVSDIMGIPRDENTRARYDVLFYENYPESVRYRVHWLVSLYYFYSRTFAISLVYSATFAIVLGVVLSEATGAIGRLIPGEEPGVLIAKSGFLLVISVLTSVFAFKYSNKVIGDSARFEIALLENHKQRSVKAGSSST